VARCSRRGTCSVPGIASSRVSLVKNANRNPRPGSSAASLCPIRSRARWRRRAGSSWLFSKSRTVAGTRCGGVIVPAHLRPRMSSPATCTVPRPPPGEQARSNGLSRHVSQRVPHAIHMAAVSQISHGLPVTSPSLGQLRPPRLSVIFTLEGGRRVMSAMLLWTLAAAPARDPRRCGAVPEPFSSGLHGRVELRVPPEGAIGVFTYC